VGTDAPPAPEASAPEPAARMMLAEEVRAAVEYARSLPPHVADTLHLLARGVTYAGIAAALAMPRGTVANTIHRTRERTGVARPRRCATKPPKPVQVAWQRLYVAISTTSGEPVPDPSVALHQFVEWNASGGAWRAQVIAVRPGRIRLMVLEGPGQATGQVFTTPHLVGLGRSIRIT
jgi:hypothetical protein